MISNGTLLDPRPSSMSTRPSSNHRTSALAQDLSKQRRSTPQSSSLSWAKVQLKILDTTRVHGSWQWCVPSLLMLSLFVCYIDANALAAGAYATDARPMYVSYCVLTSRPWSYLRSRSRLTFIQSITFHGMFIIVRNLLLRPCKTVWWGTSTIFRETFRSSGSMMWVVRRLADTVNHSWQSICCRNQVPATYFSPTQMSMAGAMTGNYYGEGAANNYYYQGSGSMLHQPVRYNSF